MRAKEESFSTPSTEFIKLKILAEEGYVKINTDGAARGNPGLAACGRVLRNSQGLWLRGYAIRLGRCTAFRAELWGIWHGLKEAWNAGYKHVIIESDSLVAITGLTKGGATVREVRLLSRIRTWIQKDWEVRIYHKYKEENACADWMTNYLLDHTDLANQIFFEEPPGGIHLLYLADLASVGRDRIVRSPKSLRKSYLERKINLSVVTLVFYIKVEISKRQQSSPEFQAINPFKKLPAIVDGRFKLFESHAILIYLASAFPGVADHWYPADISRRAKIHSVLDWHHLNLHRGAATFVLNTVLAPILGLPLNRQAAVEAENILISSLSKIENIWLKGNGRYLLGGLQLSIVDLSLVCEIMQLELLDKKDFWMQLLDKKDRDRILGPHKKVQQWIESTRNATRPHFDEVHNVLYKLKMKFSMQQTNQEDGGMDARSV
ncbi:glutathione S-transferase T2-like [Gastrolobium bilobum]|uniref:glutathione S-transferase T2-like n=1 Tax=Gastrolobium bilobum TaxID=150636 RepID=UPI002AB23EB6|nr:glutathione S-transferase T2-like [Gastrolobium bilobum]